MVNYETIKVHKDTGIILKILPLWISTLHPLFMKLFEYNESSNEQFPSRAGECEVNN